MSNAGDVLPEEYPSTDMNGSSGERKQPRPSLIALGLGLAALYTIGLFAAIHSALEQPDVSILAWILIFAFLLLAALKATYSEVSPDA